jgi:hypothetical protein
MAPEVVAKSVLNGFYHKKRRIIVPFFQPYGLFLLDALSANLSDLMVRMLSNKFFASIFRMYKGRTYHEVSM